MPFYVGDFLADTMHLGAVETGIYVRLIMHCWQHGSIPLDDRKLALIGHCDSRLWHQYRETVLQFFDVVDAATAQHKRVSTELHRCQEISNKRKAAALQKHSNSSANAVQMHTQSQSHSQRIERVELMEREDPPSPSASAGAPDTKREFERGPRAGTRPPPSRPQAVESVVARKRAPSPKALLPDGWLPPDEDFFPPSDSLELEKMRDWARANGIRKVDWPATWRNWKRRADEFNRGTSNGRRGGSVLEAADRIIAGLEAGGAEDYVVGSSGPQPLEIHRQVRAGTPKLVSSR